jgi:hypothetical protein
MNPMKTVLILLLISFSISASSQPFTFVFLNKKEQKVELPKDQLDKLMEAEGYLYSNQTQRKRLRDG